MLKMLLLLGMFNLISLFRTINLENSPYKFGKGSFYKFIGPLGFVLGSLINKEQLEGFIALIMGLVFNIILVILLLI